MKRNIRKEKGFTLIELLAVIVILAIIALISTPIIIGVIEKARKGAFEDSAYGVLDAGRIYFVDKLADDNQFAGATFTFPDGGDLKVSGEKPAGGTLSLDSTGKQALAIYDKDKKWCAFKEYGEEKITISDYKEVECKVDDNKASIIIVNKNVHGNTEGLFTDDFGNIRYRGNDSATKNYVTFNNEVWRIIGVFGGKLKLIRDDRISNPTDPSHPDEFLWNKTDTNDWTTSDLREYLNNGYYNSLNEIAKNMIEETKYNLGGNIDTQIDKKTVFQVERGTTVYNERPTEWIGKIGLMYPSDYGYAASEECNQTLYEYDTISCKNSDWLYKNAYSQWTLMPQSNSSSNVAGIHSNGDVNAYFAGYWLAIRPSLYLKSNVQIISGDGTSSNPYQLSI